MGICEGRVAIVTGAGRGVGRAYALMLAKEGAKVVVNDLGGSAAGEGADLTPAQSVVEEIKAAGGEAIVNGSDVSDWTQSQEMVRSAIDAFGGLDILINNAGILRDKMMVNMSESDWDAVIKVHLKGTFAPTHHAANYWRTESKEGRQRDARVINTSSGSGLFGNIGQSNYGAAKAGIASFSIIVARELSRIGVTVNALAPRATTRMTEGLAEALEQPRSGICGGARHVPLQRGGQGHNRPHLRRGLGLRLQHRRKLGSRSQVRCITQSGRSRGAAAPRRWKPHARTALSRAANIRSPDRMTPQ